ncbi:hypothetical protein [Metabacillus fastidiosus]|uniref:hypothetical protein n=1 Tax=Metabacillus fastidiosus TaxID=1458 RepID=UPI003D28AFAE
MLKKRSDFESDLDYKKYTRSHEFLANYDITGKTPEQIQIDMCIDEDWFPYVQKALPILLEQQRITAYHMHWEVEKLADADEEAVTYTPEQIADAEQRYRDRKSGSSS